MNSDTDDKSGNEGWSTDTSNEKPKAKWVHDHELSIGKFKQQLLFCKTLVEGAIDKQKEELQRLINMRDSLKK